MATAENKQLLQDIFAATARGDSRPLVEAMADDFRWIISGNGRWSRTYDGKPAVLTELFPVLRERIKGRIKMIPQRVIADGDHVVVEARGDNVTKAGQRYDNSYCFVFRVTGGKLAEVTEYMDTELVTAALGAPNGLTASAADLFR
ncbi:MAG: nuclear transport factor 2 family protein [Xanthobacteraceae bacterium]